MQNLCYTNSSYTEFNFQNTLCKDRKKKENDQAICTEATIYESIYFLLKVIIQIIFPLPSLLCSLIQQPPILIVGHHTLTCNTITKIHPHIFIMDNNTPQHT